MANVILDDGGTTTTVKSEPVSTTESATQSTAQTRPAAIIPKKSATKLPLQLTLLDRIPKTGDGYNIALALAVGATTEQELRTSGLFKKADLDAIIQRRTLAQTDPEALFRLEHSDLVSQGYKYTSYDATTGTFRYARPSPTTILPEGFIGPPAPGEVTWETYRKQTGLPAEAKLKSYDPTTGAVSYSLPPDKGIIDKLNRFSLPDGTYNYALALAEKAVSPEELVKIGIPEEDVEKLKTYAQARQETGAALSGESIYLQKQYTDYKRAEEALSEAMRKIDRENPKLSGREREKLYEQLPEYQSYTEISTAIGDPLKREAALGKRIGAGAANLLFAPARSLYPEVTARDISGLEWTIGGAQIATIGLAAGGGSLLAGVAPIVGKVLNVAAMGTLAGTSIYSTSEQIKESIKTGKWNPAQLTLSLAMDTALSAATLGALKAPIARSAVKNPVNVDKAEQFVKGLEQKATIEGISESPLASPHTAMGPEGAARVPEYSAIDVMTQKANISQLERSLEAARRAPKDLKDINLEKSIIENLRIARSDLNYIQMGPTAQAQVEVTAQYGDFAKASADYAKTYKAIGDIQENLRFKTDLMNDLIKTGNDEAITPVARRISQLEKELADLQLKLPELEKGLSNTEIAFRDGFRDYVGYLKDNEIYPGMQTMERGSILENLPRNSAERIRTVIDEIKFGENSQAAIAAQEQRATAARNNLDATVKSTVSGDINSIANQVGSAVDEVATEEAKLARLKLGNQEQAAERVSQISDAIRDIDEIMKEGKLSGAEKLEMGKVRTQLSVKETELSNTLMEQTVKGKGLGDIAKQEDILDAQGKVIGRRVYGDEGTFKYDVDEQGRTIEYRKADGEPAYGVHRDLNLKSSTYNQMIDSDGKIAYSARTEEHLGGGKTRVRAPSEPATETGGTGTVTERATEYAQDTLFRPGIVAVPTIKGVIGAPEEVPQVGKEIEIAPLTEGATITAPETETVPGVTTEGATVTAPRTTTEPATISTTEAATQTGAETGTETGTTPKTTPETRTETETQTQVQTQVQTALQTALQPETQLRTEPIVLFKGHKKKTGEEIALTEEEMQGAVTFRHGLVWLLQLPTMRGDEDLYIMDAPPPSSVYRIDIGKPRETVSALSGGPPPRGTFTISRGMYNITYSDGELSWAYNEKYSRGRAKARAAREYRAERRPEMIIKENIPISTREFESFGTPGITVEKMTTPIIVQPIVKGVVQ